VTGVQRIGKNLEGSSPIQIEILSRHLSVVTEETEEEEEQSHDSLVPPE
jgi:hypothetical protein